MTRSRTPRAPLVARQAAARHQRSCSISATASKGAAIDRQAVRCRGQWQLRQGVDQRGAVRSSRRSPLPPTSVSQRPPRRTTHGQTATRTRACHPGRTPAGPKSQPLPAHPRSQPLRAPRETERRSGLRSERCAEHRRWATCEPTPVTATLPRGRSSSPRDQRSRWQVAAAAPATVQSHRAMEVVRDLVEL